MWACRIRFLSTHKRGREFDEVGCQRENIDVIDLCGTGAPHGEKTQQLQIDDILSRRRVPDRIDNIKTGQQLVLCPDDVCILVEQWHNRQQWFRFTLIACTDDCHMRLRVTSILISGRLQSPAKKGVAFLFWWENTLWWEQELNTQEPDCVTPLPLRIGRRKLLLASFVLTVWSSCWFNSFHLFLQFYLWLVRLLLGPGKGRLITWYTLCYWVPVKALQ